MRVTTRGLTFDVDVAGPEDGPPVLLLHGFPENRHMWAPVVPFLHAAGLRTIAPDQRGYSPGARPSEVEAYHVDELAADALALLDALGIDRAHVVGHDWGAVVGWRLAAHHAARVLTWTAVSVPHPAAFDTAVRDDPDQQRRSSYILLFRQQGKAEEVLLADDAARLRRLFDDARVSSARYVEPLREPGALTAALNWYRAYNRRVSGDPTPVSVPTTFVWSDGDVAIGPTAAHGCAAHVSADYRMVTLGGVTHWIAEQAPAALAGAIIDRTRSV
ncbi:alpha/beta fold hydrolase [Virgisporangium aliadipatigenens]|uniref:alpha/beta fold hydrolase n=1 Tax=Virgisporangium aliadipatigenens TaxID=741659 RepID=UPI001943390D|nr:alpha/beta fold hydrolase [Virgisporangium aliadipatigenens]